METAILTIQGRTMDVVTTKNGGFILKFLVGEKVIKVHTKVNGIHAGDKVLVACDPPEDAKFPMMFENADLRKVANK